MIRRSNILLCILAMLLFVNAAYGQPAPIRYYPLNGNANETVNQKNGTIQGMVVGTIDRFGAANGAMSFSNRSYISTPNFFEGSTYNNGFTISFWVNIPNPLTKHTGIQPWEDSDIARQAFYARNGLGNILLGLYQRRDRVVINRCTQGATSKQDWGVWLWDPVNFTTQTGWYHIVISYEQSRTTLYEFTPDGRMESQMYYFGIQSLNDAVSWGLGGTGWSVVGLDDFKVFNQAVSREQAIKLNAQEALPDGMYYINPSYNVNLYVHTVGHSLTQADAEIYNLVPNYTSQYRWVFEKIPNEPNTYRIRMAYTDQYLHLKNNSVTASAVVEIDNYDSSAPASYKWLVLPSGTAIGSFHIRAATNPGLYLHTQNHSTSASAKLEIFYYEGSYADRYQWRLKQIKSRHEIEDMAYLTNRSGYEMVTDANTSLYMFPTLPLTQTPLQLLSSRTSVTSLLECWRFDRVIDDAYTIAHIPTIDRYLVPAGYLPTSNAKINIQTKAGAYNRDYLWIPVKTNPFGRKYQFLSASDQTLNMKATSNEDGAYVQLSLTGMTPNGLASWQAYKVQNGVSSAQKQIYDLTPGIYKISSMADPTKYMAPENLSWNNKTKTLIKSFDNDRYTSFYWVVDYERDNNGDPVRDGTYTIMLFSTDQKCLCPIDNNIQNTIRLNTKEIIGDDPIESYKWYIRSARDGSGSFFIQNASKQNLYVHLSNNSTAENMTTEILYYNEGQASTYKWKFEKVSIVAPFATGTFKFKLATSTSLSEYLHVKARATTSGAKLEIYPYNDTYADWYKWRVVKQIDNTYVIQRSADQRLHVHPTGNSAAISTVLEQAPYVYGYGPYYKWIIESGSVAGSYRFRLVADPTKFIHMTGHSSDPSTPVELLDYRQGYTTTYEWILQNP